MKIKYTLTILAFFSALSCTKLDEVWYDSITEDTFFKNENDLNAALYRPFTHMRWYVSRDRWYMQELSADQFCITTKGRHWYNGGEGERFQYHKWTVDEGKVWDTWRVTLMGVALSLDAKNALKNTDYSAMNIPEERKSQDTSELNTLIGYFYMRGMDFFGGLPIFTDLERDNLPRNSAKEVFAHSEALFLGAIEHLPKKKKGNVEEGAISQGVVASMLAELYFNAITYIEEDMFEECAEVCEDIIAGKYGYYDLDKTWNGVFGFDNEASPEAIWITPSEFNRLTYDWFYADFYHYETYKYFDVDGLSHYNGCHLQPSRKPDSTLYSSEFKLGSPYEKFNDLDLRKQPYAYKEGGDYTGLFLVGEQISPINGDTVFGAEEYSDKLIVLDDRVAKFSTYKKNGNFDESTYESKISEGEENTGIRLVKVPIPSNDNINLRWGGSQPVIRLAEIYYMLAECRMRLGKKTEAARLINKVRERNFVEGVDPDPVTEENLDKYRMVDEWGMEFLGEGRRRTDLIRWNLFTTERWWAHEPTNDPNRRLFPVPTNAISGNNNLLPNNSGY